MRCSSSARLTRSKYTAKAEAVAQAVGTGREATIHASSPAAPASPVRRDLASARTNSSVSKRAGDSSERSTSPRVSPSRLMVAERSTVAFCRPGASEVKAAAPRSARGGRSERHDVGRAHLEEHAHFAFRVAQRIGGRVDIALGHLVCRLLLEKKNAASGRVA